MVILSSTFQGSDGIKLFLLIMERKQSTCGFMDYEATVFLHMYILDWTVTNSLLYKIYGIDMKR